MCKHIAVYGTLRYGGPANGLMRGCKYLGVDRVYGSLLDLGRFPGLMLGTEAEPDNQVVVDIYEIPAERETDLLASWDRYEGYYPKDKAQSLYTRHKVLTVEGNLEVWVYEYNWPTAKDPFIKGGDWLNRE